MKEKDGKGENLIILFRKSFDLFQSLFSLVLLCLPYQHNMPDLIKSIRASVPLLFKTIKALIFRIFKLVKGEVLVSFSILRCLSRNVKVSKGG